MLVSDLLDEIIGEVVSDLTAAQMFKYFISACRQAPTYVRDQLLIATDSLSVSSGVSTGDLTDLDPTFIRERFLWYEDDEGHRIPILKPPSKGFFHDAYSPATSGKPKYYRIYQQTIEFDVLADETLTIGFDYFAALTDSMTTSTDLAINEQFAEAIKFLAKSEYYEQYEEDNKKALRAERKGMGLLDRIEEEYQDQEFNGQVEETEDY